MRLMMKIAIPNEPCNSMMKAGTFGPTMGRILAAIKPEAAYFTTIDGQRGGFIVVDIDDASKVMDELDEIEAEIGRGGEDPGQFPALAGTMRAYYQSFVQ